MDLVAIFFGAVVFLGTVLLFFVYLSTPGRNKKHGIRKTLDENFIKNKWGEISEMFSQGGPANYRQSIIEADKLVDHVLMVKVSGETMSERLKNARNLFEKNTYNNLWTAHKIRNKVAHEADFEGLSSDARLAIRYFKEAMINLGHSLN